MYLGRINIFNPYGPQILERGIENTLSQTDKFYAPFLQLLGSRWIVAADHDPEVNVLSFSSFDEVDCDFIVLHDWFMSDLVRYTKGTNALENYSGRIMVFSDLPIEATIGSHDCGAMNSFRIDRNARWVEEKIYPYFHYGAVATGKVPIVPMGCSQAWLPSVVHHDKIIFLDEPHTSLLACFDDEDDIRTKLYRHALDVSRFLHERGFKIISFCRTSDEKFQRILEDNSFIEIHQVGGWVPFSDLVLSYAKASLFFSFTSETFGYPLYENLQLGSGVITYSEANDPFTFMQMQNSAMLSMYMTPELAANIVCEFYNRYSSYSMRPIIAQDAFQRFSSETFIKRLRQEVQL